jgi:hypothetical protein
MSNQERDLSGQKNIRFFLRKNARLSYERIRLKRGKKAPKNEFYFEGLKIRRPQARSAA